MWMQFILAHPWLHPSVKYSLSNETFRLRCLNVTLFEHDRTVMERAWRLHYICRVGGSCGAIDDSGYSDLKEEEFFLSLRLNQPIVSFKLYTPMSGEMILSMYIFYLVQPVH